MDATDGPALSSAPPGPSPPLTKNQKKKLRKKLAKRYRTAAVQRQEEPQPSGAQEPASKRAKQHGEGGQRLTLSVSTLPGTDQQAQPARLSSELPCITEEAAVEAAAPASAGPVQPPSPASRPPQLGMHGRARVDLSHAAALIAAQLLGGGSAAAQPEQPQLQPQQEHRSPAASGCHSVGGCAGAPTGTRCHGGAGVTSVVTSTVTSGAGGAGGPPAGAQQQAGVARPGKRRRRGGPLDSDCEESDGDGNEGSGLEDWDDCRAPGGCGRPGGCTGGPGEDCSEACAAAAQGAGARLAASPAGAGAGAQQHQGLEGGSGAGGPARRRRVFVYGNYHRYYGYRLGQAFSEDPRLQCFERGWFANRRCLDVGCNEGVVTLAIATKFGCKSMMGVDIDAQLIAKACMHLREERSAAATRVVEVRRGGTAPAERRAARAAHAALAQTWFVHADFVDSEGEPGSFDTITCLSVIKWVHLNRGDEGMEAMLAKFWRLLAPGGLLLLEPQPWKSYKAAAGKMRKQPVSPSTYFHRLGQLTLRPEALPHLLVDRLGFRLVKRLQAPDAAAGFDRPMYLFRKPS